MLANLFFYSVFLGVLGFLPLADKYKKISSLFFVAALSLMAFYFFSGYQEQNTDSFSFFWMRTQKYRIEININSSLKNFIRLFPVFVMTLLMAVYKLFEKKVSEKENFYALLFFNLANMIVLVSSQNLVQLLTCIYVADIISQAIIEKFGASKKYIYYSLFADLGLFMIFAMIQGKLKSFNLDGFVAYKKIGRHKDFVAICVMLFIFIKMGLFMFQASLLELQHIKKEKLISVISLSSVLSGFFVFTKIYPLLQISDYSTPIMSFMMAASALWGLVCGIVMGGAKKQIIYFNMLLYAFAMYVFINKGDFDTELSIYLLSGYFTSCALSLSGKYLKILSRTAVFAAWVAVFYFYRGENSSLYYIFVALILFSLIMIGNVSYFCRFERLQKADFFSKVYDVLLIKPIMVLGRALWLLVDFLIMEKHLTGGVEAVGNISSGYVEKIKNCSFSEKMWWLLYLLLLFAASFYFGGIR